MFFLLCVGPAYLKKNNDLREEKTKSLNPILANQLDIEEQIKAKQKEIDEANALVAQYNADIVSINKQIENIQSQTSKIDEINSEIKTLIIAAGRSIGSLYI